MTEGTAIGPMKWAQKYQLSAKETNLDDDDSLLDNVVDFGLNQVQQRAHTTLGSLLHLNGTAADSTHRLAHEVNIHFSCIPNIVKIRRLITSY